MLDRNDIGHRVVVRRRVGIGPTGRQMLTDVLGELIALDQAALTVRADDGTQRVIARAEVVAAKRIPPRPARPSEIAALERIADAAWPAPVREPLGEWYLRAAQGWTSRGNSALPLGDPGLPLEQAVQECQRWYGARGLTPRIMVPLPLRRDVAAVLTRSGWQAQPPVLVQTARIAKILAAPVPAPAPDHGIELHATPSAEFLRATAGWKPGQSGADLPQAAWNLLTAVPAVRFAEIRRAGAAGAASALMAQGRGALVAQTLHLGLVEVAEPARRRGLGLHVSRSLAAWAAEQGADRAVLQVEEANTAAVRLYQRLGFTTHHRYMTYAWYS